MAALTLESLHLEPCACFQVRSNADVHVWQVCVCARMWHFRNTYMKVMSGNQLWNLKRSWSSKTKLLGYSIFCLFCYQGRNVFAYICWFVHYHYTVHNFFKESTWFFLPLLPHSMKVQGSIPRSGCFSLGSFRNQLDGCKSLYVISAMN